MITASVSIGAAKIATSPGLSSKLAHFRNYSWSAGWLVVDVVDVDIVYLFSLSGNEIM